MNEKTHCVSCGVSLGPNDRHRFEANPKPGRRHGEMFDYCKVCCPNCFGGSGKGNWSNEENTNGRT